MWMSQWWVSARFIVCYRKNRGSDSEFTAHSCHEPSRATTSGGGYILRLAGSNSGGFSVSSFRGDCFRGEQTFAGSFVLSCSRLSTPELVVRNKNGLSRINQVRCGGSLGHWAELHSWRRTAVTSFDSCPYDNGFHLQDAFLRAA